MRAPGIYHAHALQISFSVSSLSIILPPSDLIQLRGIFAQINIVLIMISKSGALSVVSQ